MKKIDNKGYINGFDDGYDDGYLQAMKSNEKSLIKLIRFYLKSLRKHIKNARNI